MAVFLAFEAPDRVGDVRSHANRSPGDTDCVWELLLGERQDQRVGWDRGVVLSALEAANFLDALVPELLQDIVLLDILKIGHSYDAHGKALGGVDSDSNGDCPCPVLRLDA